MLHHDTVPGAQQRTGSNSSVITIAPKEPDKLFTIQNNCGTVLSVKKRGEQHQPMWWITSFQ